MPKNAKKIFVQSGDNTEKIWAHWLFEKQKTNVTKARNMASGGLRSTVSPPSGGQGVKPQKSFDFFRLKHGKAAIVKVKIQ